MNTKLFNRLSFHRVLGLIFLSVLLSTGTALAKKAGKGKGQPDLPREVAEYCEVNHCTPEMIQGFLEEPERDPDDETPGGGYDDGDGYGDPSDDGETNPGFMG